MYISIRNILPEYFPDIFKSHFLDWKKNITYEHDRSYQDNTYFITIRLSYGLNSSNDNNTTESAFKEFNGFYTKLCMDIVPGKFIRKRNVLPLTIASIDSDGSKGFISRTDPIQGAHLHAVMLVHPNHMEAFQDFIRPENLKALCGRWRNIESIDVQKFDPCKASVQQLFGYVLKHNTKTGQDHYRIYPI